MKWLYLNVIRYLAVEIQTIPTKVSSLAARWHINEHSSNRPIKQSIPTNKNFSMVRSFNSSLVLIHIQPVIINKPNFNSTLVSYFTDDTFNGELTAAIMVSNVSCYFILERTI